MVFFCDYVRLTGRAQYVASASFNDRLIFYFRIISARSLNHIANVNEITSKAVIMYKENNEPAATAGTASTSMPTGLKKRNPPTPVLFLIGDGTRSPDVRILYRIS